MRILITGTGRGGTSLLREVVKGFGIARFYGKEEDRGFFLYDKLPESYLTKLSLPWKGHAIENITKFMKQYDNLYIAFSIRHPVDTCMSKIVRGGGISADSTLEKAIQAVKEFYHIYKTIIKLFPKRTITVRMEDLILHSRREVERIAQFFGTEVTDEALRFYEHNTNRHQFKRYGQEIDKSQISLYKRWDTAFDGYFKEKQNDVKFLIEAFKEKEVI